MIDQKIEHLLDGNRVAVASFDAAALAVPSERFHESAVPNNWSPAAHVDHVARAYEAAVADLERGQSMRLIGTAGQRRIWRLIGLTIVRWFGRLPRAKAPREIRPAGFEHRNRAELLVELDERFRSFDRAVRRVAEAEPGRKFMHPYFGALNLRDGVRLLAVHTGHHTRALERASADVPHSAGTDTRN